ncbi:hypothetical protein MTBSS4_120073 [Magnetospirillum sp. SS-4]|nr:hypothetical protein MTBSS4_120073 [Magnetospirillum sp. SS-4]
MRWGAKHSLCSGHLPKLILLRVLAVILPELHFLFQRFWIA